MIDTAVLDCESPTVVNVEILEVMTHEATIRITTDEETSASILYGMVCSALDEAVVDGTLALVHEVRISNLDDNQLYYFMAGGIDAAGNEAWDDNNGICYSFTTADVPDYFTTVDGAPSLDGKSVTFTPYANVDQYRACAEAITALPTDPNQGMVISLSDDDSESVSAASVWLYGEEYTTLHISSNGRITFDSGSTDYTESIGEHFSSPSIAMLWDDLNPSAAGTVRYATFMNKVVVTFINVPEYSNTGSNTFQCEMFYDGVIRLSWLGIDSSDNIIGLSAGSGQPTDFEESDLDTSNDCGDPTIPGDVNGDGLVDVTDVLAVMDSWGVCDGCPADLNNDGVVDVVDLLEVVGNWG